MKNQIDKRRAGAERIGQIGKALKKAEVCGVLNEKILSPKVLFHSMFNSLKNMHYHKLYRSGWLPNTS